MSYVSIALSGMLGRRSRYGVAVSLRRVASVEGRPVADRPRGITVPVEGNAEAEVQPGLWLVEAYLPSGGTVEREFSVSAADELYRLILPISAYDAVGDHARNFDYPSASGMNAALATQARTNEFAVGFAVRSVHSACTRAEWTDILGDAGSVPFEASPTRSDGGYHIAPLHSERCRTWVEVSLEGARTLVSVPSSANGGSWSLIVSDPEEDEASIRLTDERTGPLMDYLASGRIDAASSILKQIEQEIEGASGSGHFADDAIGTLGGALQVCAAAYAATKCPGKQEWNEVVCRLATEAWLPDCAILAGRAALFDGTGEDGWRRAAGHFNDAMDRGIPFYAMGLDYLAEGLTILSGSCDAADANLKIVKGVSRCAIPNESITVIRVQKPER